MVAASGDNRNFFLARAAGPDYGPVWNGAAVRAATVIGVGEQLAPRLRVAVLANRRVVGEALADALRNGRRPIVVGSTDPRQIQALVPPPDAVVVVGSRANGSTSAAVTMARRRWRKAVVVALADTDRVDDGMFLVRQGADTWHSRSDGLAALRSTLDRIAAGERQLLPTEAMRYIAASLREPRPIGRTARLTARERQVLACFVYGLSRPDIAARLGIALPTLRTHVQNILRKLELHSIQQAAALGVREGIVPDADDA